MGYRHGVGLRNGRSAHDPFKVQYGHCSYHANCIKTLTVAYFTGIGLKTLSLSYFTEIGLPL